MNLVAEPSAPVATLPEHVRPQVRTMKAAVFVEPGRIALEDKPAPEVGPLGALLRITTTTICGSDVHILRGEYPVSKRLTVGHEPVGVIERLGSAVQGYRKGQRVVARTVTPSGRKRRREAYGFDPRQAVGRLRTWRRRSMCPLPARRSQSRPPLYRVPSPHGARL